MKKVICMALAIVMVLSALPVVAVMAAKEMFQVSAVTITGIDTPYAGKKPDMTAAVPDGVSYKIEDGGISWAEYDADWEWLRCICDRF